MAKPCPDPIDCTDTYGRLQIDGWSLQGPAWCAYDLGDLYGSSNFAGDNWVVEDRPGAIAQPLLCAETTYSLPMVFSGAVNREGTPWANPAGGLIANRRSFEDRFITPIRTGTASLAAILDVPDPDDPEGWIPLAIDVQPLRLSWQFTPEAYGRGVLTLRVPECGILTVEPDEGE